MSGNVNPWKKPAAERGPPKRPQPLSLPEIVAQINALGIQLGRLVNAQPVQSFEDAQLIYTLETQKEELTRQLEEARATISGKNSSRSDFEEGVTTAMTAKDTEITRLSRELAATRTQRETNINTLKAAAGITNPFVTVGEIEAAIRGRAAAAPALPAAAAGGTPRPTAAAGVAAGDAARRRLMDAAAAGGMPAGGAAPAAAAVAPGSLPVAGGMPAAVDEAAGSAAALTSNLSAILPNVPVSTTRAALGGRGGLGIVGKGIGGIPGTATLASGVGAALGRGRTGIENPGTTPDARARVVGNASLGGGARRRRQTHHRRRHQKKTHKRHVRFA